MNDKLLLTFNAGSSTIKIGLFTVEDGSLRQTGRGKIDFRETPLRLELSDGPDRLDIILEAEQDEELDTVISETFSRLARHYDLSNVVAIGHRVVHGGDIFDGPVFVDDKTIIQMQALVPLAPLHQSQAMHLIHAIRRLRPNIPQTASFDTAFHRTNADIVRRFALPRALHDKGIKRYGFHGLSYKFIAGALTREWPMEAAGKVVVAHMGSGVSLCALDSCVSRDTSMGFSTLDGVPMATRCGTLDAGVVLHLARNGESVGQLETLLYHKSGLLGVSGISGDTRVLLDSEKEEAREALELFTLRIAGEIARLANTLGGLDTLVFTGGIGENQPAVRAEICTRLMWLGIDLDPKANEGSQSVITSQASRITVLVIPTDEERVIADESLHVLRSTPS
ncbi:acetate/propionate family kinase [Agrobacterium genomosp. 3]|jgi:acetate kinase|uniref:Acetate kinase n=2 Tax=Hyphomicrobiales TaxID=356 RepID=A0AA50CJD4_9HYPH|nr:MULTISPECIES: acetate/propionate family kinase [Hyphomicrobiales]KRA03897.1 acetate kinase [Rhizobium sp. Root564]MBX8800166.1 acetate/propionate family kinase [Ochrobactrum sp. MR28]MBX8815778.1 acetate/propionate family kinase [Ochrobactrum sp. MR31]MCA1865736.1 acetate/propionate family kinase [Agrobacterium tomkonis]MCA1876088.1 acetate/propionate family kinase [Agrobacterium tumefaciens]PZU79201.1 MAG: acetate/propionate family kinase [Rhizobium sp.]